MAKKRESKHAQGSASGVATGAVPSTSTLRSLFAAARLHPSATSPASGSGQDPSAASLPSPSQASRSAGSSSRVRFPWHPALQWTLAALASMYGAVPHHSFDALALDICRAAEGAIRRDARSFEADDMEGSVLMIASHLLRLREQVGPMLNDSASHGGNSNHESGVSAAAAGLGNDSNGSVSTKPIPSSDSFESEAQTKTEVSLAPSVEALGHFMSEIVAAPSHLLRMGSDNPVVRLLREGLPEVSRRAQDASTLREAMEESLRRACQAWIASVIAMVHR